MLAPPVYHLPPIASIDPQPPQLFTGAAEPCDETTRPRRIGDRGGRHAHSHQAPQRSDQQMALPPFDVFAFVVATLPSQFCGLDALAVEPARRWVLVTPCLLAHLGAQCIVEALPVPAVMPLTKIPVHTGPLWLLMGEHAPFDAPVDDRKNGLDHRVHIPLAVTPTRLRWWDQILEKIPFGISEVSGVWIGVHPHSVLN